MTTADRVSGYPVTGGGRAVTSRAALPTAAFQGRAVRPQARVQLDTGKPYGAVLAPILPVTLAGRLVRVASGRFVSSA